MQIAESAALLAAAVGTVMLGAGNAEAKSLNFEQTFGKFSEHTDGRARVSGCDVIPSSETLPPTNVANMVIVPIRRRDTIICTPPRRVNSRAVAVQRDKSNINLHVRNRHHHGGLNTNRSDD